MAGNPAKRPRTDGSKYCISPSQVAELQANGPVFMKVLVSNNTAGVLIGKGGAALKELEGSTGCTIKISGGNLFYPGSGNRVVCIAGKQDGVELMLQAVVSAGAEADRQLAEREGRASEDRVVLQVVLPNAACGMVIGKKGVTQKELSEKTGVPIKISPHGENPVQGERLCNLTGPVQGVTSAVLHICSIVQNDTSLAEHLETPADGSGPQATSVAAAWPVTRAPPPSQTGWRPSQPPPPVGSRPLNTSAEQVADHPCTIYFEISDAEAAHVIGKGGVFLQTVCSETGAKVQLSKRGEELVPGSTNRQVTVTGPLQGVHAAHALVLERALEVAV